MLTGPWNFLDMVWDSGQVPPFLWAGGGGYCYSTSLGVGFKVNLSGLDPASWDLSRLLFDLNDGPGMGFGAGTFLGNAPGLILGGGPLGRGGSRTGLGSPPLCPTTPWSEDTFFRHNPTGC